MSFSPDLFLPEAEIEARARAAEAKAAAAEAAAAEAAEAAEARARAAEAAKAAEAEARRLKSENLRAYKIAMCERMIAANPKSSSWKEKLAKLNGNAPPEPPRYLFDLPSKISLLTRDLDLLQRAQLAHDWIEAKKNAGENCMIWLQDRFPEEPSAKRSCFAILPFSQALENFPEMGNHLPLFEVHQDLIPLMAEDAKKNDYNAPISSEKEAVFGLFRGCSPADRAEKKLTDQPAFTRARKLPDQIILMLPMLGHITSSLTIAQPTEIGALLDVALDSADKILSAFNSKSENQKLIAGRIDGKMRFIMS